jgi:hypothetical protein
MNAYSNSQMIQDFQSVYLIITSLFRTLVISQ